MNTTIFLIIWGIGIIPSYFVSKYFMILFKKSLEKNGYKYNILFTNNDMIMCLFMSIFYSWANIIIATLVHLNLLSKTYAKWLEKKSKY